MSIIDSLIIFVFLWFLVNAMVISRYRTKIGEKGYINSVLENIYSIIAMVFLFILMWRASVTDIFDDSIISNNKFIIITTILGIMWLIMSIISLIRLLQEKTTGIEKETLTNIKIESTGFRHLDKELRGTVNGEPRLYIFRGSIDRNIIKEVEDHNLKKVTILYHVSTHRIEKILLD